MGYGLYHMVMAPGKDSENGTGIVAWKMVMVMSHGSGCRMAMVMSHGNGNNGA